MKAEYLIGNEVLANNTVQDLVDYFMQMTPKTRRSSYVRLVAGDAVHEIKWIGAAQSDQSEKHELKIYIVAEVEPLAPQHTNAPA